jgi:hypothetical protein
MKSHKITSIWKKDIHKLVSLELQIRLSLTNKDMWMLLLLERPWVSHIPVTLFKCDKVYQTSYMFGFIKILPNSQTFIIWVCLNHFVKYKYIG